VPVGVPIRVFGHGARLDVEWHPEPLEIGAELCDVVAVHEVVGVRVQQMHGGAGEHEGDVVLAGHDTDADAHGLEGAARRARILADEDHDRLVGHDRALS